MSHRSRISDISASRFSCLHRRYFRALFNSSRRIIHILAPILSHLHAVAATCIGDISGSYLSCQHSAPLWMNSNSIKSTIIAAVQSCLTCVCLLQTLGNVFSATCMLKHFFVALCLVDIVSFVLRLSPWPLVLFDIQADRLR